MYNITKTMFIELLSLLAKGYDPQSLLSSPLTASAGVLVVRELTFLTGCKHHRCSQSGCVLLKHDFRIKWTCVGFEGLPDLLSTDSRTLLIKKK